MKNVFLGLILIAAMASCEKEEYDYDYCVCEVRNYNYFTGVQVGDMNIQRTRITDLVGCVDHTDSNPFNGTTEFKNCRVE